MIYFLQKAQHVAELNCSEEDNMDLPESALSPEPNKVYDRNKGKWVNMQDVSFWEILISIPMFWALVVVGGFSFCQWLFS